jgi:dihydropyrimidinase
MDLVIRDGTIVTSGSVQEADLAIEDGRIVAVGRGSRRATETVDARGLLVLPGVVDPHVHLLDLTVAGTVAEAQVDDIAHGTRAAAAGGVTTVCDFAYQRTGEGLRHAIDLAIDEATGSAWVDFSVHAWVSDPTPTVRDEVPGLVDDGFPSFKFWMALDTFDARLEEHLALMEAVGGSGGLAVIHCEDRALMEFCTERLIEQGRTHVTDYVDAKPRAVEVSATARAMEMVRVTGTPGYIVHVSCRAALDVTTRARAEGLPIFVETRPLYLHLTSERYAEPNDLGTKYVGVPPLRDDEDRAALWTGLATRDIDTVATDHVGWSLQQKLATPRIPEIASGVQALETTLPLLYSEGVRKDRISLPRMVELLSTNPARILGAFPRKGSLAVGADADIVLFDPERRVTIRAEDLHGATDFDPYEGIEVVGWPQTTFLRGERVFERGELVAEPRGARVPRVAFASASMPGT